ncbi:hypothetical protein FIBSPDRAFT_1048124 [Athelia psychrophila]|uniref:Uncharacterized protein n=1 Tax=Athelia psychrophila TaxID=1759441 RepID=A0A166E7R1_9AGAM|nr:hypothetical protein FIBSPDRAFT_1048124 [Fibularhizoctonia sp. CBS 109695]
MSSDKATHTSEISDKDMADSSSLEHWLCVEVESMRRRVIESQAIDLEDEFLKCGRMLYTMRVTLPAYPDYQALAAHLEVRARLDTHSKEIFEHLKGLWSQFLDRAQIAFAVNLEGFREYKMNGAWDQFVKTLGLEEDYDSSSSEDGPLEESQPSLSILQPQPGPAYRRIPTVNALPFMRSAQARASGDVPGPRNLFAGLIKGVSRASESPSPKVPKLSGESHLWGRHMRQVIVYSRPGLDHVTASDFKILRAFRDCAKMLYSVRMRASAHPDYQIFTLDPQAQFKLDADAVRLFECLKFIRMEILDRAQARGATQRKSEAEEAWNGLIRVLQFEDEATVVNEEIHSPPEGNNLEDISLASSSEHQALANTTSQNEHGIIPDEPPSPRSYWIDLNPIEDTAHERRCIPEEPPVPLSCWIDLRPIEDYKGLIPEVAPEAPSTFLDLRPLEDT